MNIAFFSTLRLRHSSGWYLASIPTNYSNKDGSNQQIVFCTADSDESTLWIIHPQNARDYDVTQNGNVSDGVTIRLQHAKTRMNLHSHSLKSPVSRQQEVSCFGAQGDGNFDDNWEITSRDQKGLATQTKLCLKHVNTGQWLHSHSERLPASVGTNMQEVTCYTGDDAGNDWEIVEVLPPPEDLSLQPFLRAKIGDRDVLFERSTDVVNWLKKEETAFAWVRSGPGFHSTVNGHVKTKFADLKQKASSASSCIESKNLQTLHDALKKSLEITHSTGMLISSESAQFHFVESVKEKNLAVATHVLAYFLHQAVEATSHGLGGLFEALCFERGIADSATAELAALRDAREKAATELDDVFSQVQQLRVTVEALLAAARNQNETNELSFKTAIAGGQKALEDITKTYDKHMSLRASVEYWGKKARRHKWWAFGFGVLAFCGGVVALWFLLEEIHALLPSAQTPGMSGEWWRLGPVVLIATFALWGVRIFVQLFYSNLHLEVSVTLSAIRSELTQVS